MAETMSALHNQLAGPIVASIVKPVLEAGGRPTAILVLLESVIAGVVLAVTRLGGDEVVLEKIFEGVKGRLAELRLGPVHPAGEA